MQPRYRRLFIGLPLSEQLRKRIGREIPLWPEIATLPTRSENLHVPLMHLGFLLEDDIFDVTEKIRLAVAEVPSFDLYFDTIELFEDSANPKMIYLSGQECEELLSLHQALEDVFTNKTHDAKSFRPHVVLAKIKKAKWLALEPNPAIDKKVNLGESINEVVLFESLTIDGKRTYEAIATFPLE
jgi:2'-5' RNA ligase